MGDQASQIPRSFILRFFLRFFAGEWKLAMCMLEHEKELLYE